MVQKLHQVNPQIAIVDQATRVTATLSGGGFSCNIPLVIGVNLVVVRGTDIAGNVAGSNFHVSLTGTLPAATSLLVTPGSASVLVGGTQQFAVVDQQGRPRSDATWSVDNTLIATIDTSSAPTLTAVAVGQATLTATVGSITAQAQVNVLSGTSLPSGGAIWSLPLNGASELNIVPAVPSSSGVDVFALDNTGTLSAVSADGNVVWQAPVNAFGAPTTIIPDFSGNALVKAASNVSFDGQYTHVTYKVQKMDANTHQLTTLYTFAEELLDSSGNPVVPVVQAVIPHPTGSLFVQENDKVKVFDISTGQLLGSPTLDTSTFTLNGVTTPNTTGYGKIIVAGDGNAYWPYIYSAGSRTGTSGLGYTEETISHLMVLRVSPDGSYAKIQLTTQTQDLTVVSPWAPPGIDPNRVFGYSEHRTYSGPDGQFGELAITNGGSGVAVFATTQPTSCANSYFAQYVDSSGNDQTFSQTDGCGDGKSHTQVSYVSQDAVTSHVNDALVLNNNNGNLIFSPTLQREDGSYVGTYPGTYGSYTVVAMGSSGGLLWQQPFAIATAITPLYATSDGGVIVRATPTSGQPTLATLDQNGNVTSQITDTGAKYSWTNQWYVGQSGAISAEVAPQIHFPPSWIAIVNGNHSGTGVPVQQTWYPQLPSCNDSTLTPTISCPGPKEAMGSALAALKSLVGSACLTCAAYVFQPLGSINDQQAFFKFLGRTPGMYDGTQSNMPRSQICKWGSWDGFLCSTALSDNNETIAQFFQNLPGLNATSQMPAKNGLLVFFRPSSVCDVYSTPMLVFGQGLGIFNQARLFHEALHGFYGDGDITIQNAFGLPNVASQNITFYIQQNVFGRTTSVCGN